MSMLATRAGSRRLALSVITAAALAAGALGPSPAASAASSPLPLSSDPFTQATCKASAATNHHTEVEPDSFSNGSTIVAAFQVGRIYDGGACAIGIATSTDNGLTWTDGLLPGITKWSPGSSNGGSNDRATDASVAYDAAHKAWLVSSLTLLETPTVHGNAVVTSGSTDGLHWSTPVVTATGSDLDKNWIVCDNTPTSRYYGHCYTEWDDHGNGNRLQMSTSTDGGLSWSGATTNNAGVIGGQPVVRPDGTVIVPTANANETAIGAFNSTNGGASWSPVTTIATINHHTVAGSLREGPLPSAEIDRTGTVYVAWSDCRFRRACKTNDIVVTHSTNPTGTAWSAVSRIPTDPTTSGVDHFIPGLAVNKTTAAATAQIGLTYYFYPSGSTQLSVAFTSSADAGTTWTTPQTIISGMASTWAANTSQGRMVGDYISTSYDAKGLAHGIFGTAGTPAGGANAACTTTALDNCTAAIATFTPGLASGLAATANDPVLVGGNGGGNAASLWNLVDNNGSKHRD